MSRFFKLREAEKVLPVLETLLKTAITSKKALDQLEAQVGELGHRVIMNGGILVDFQRIAQFKEAKEVSVNSLREALAKIEATGCLIKDLDTGLVDFPCMVEEREVYLCWKLGEPTIGFWHNTDEGFAGRKPITGDWIEQEGDSPRPN